MLKAYVTSIGEPTTDLCVWSLERQGYEVDLIHGSSTLWQKLQEIYDRATDTFLRVDADVIVNKNVKDITLYGDVWWMQAQTYCWFAQDMVHGGIQLYGKETLPILRKHIGDAEIMERPETFMCRLEGFHNPRRFETWPVICGLNGYGQGNLDRVKHVKKRRGQYEHYDFELAERISAL